MSTQAQIKNRVMNTPNVTHINDSFATHYPTKDASRFKENDQIQSFYEGRWHNATIKEALAEGSYKIRFDELASTMVVDIDKIRVRMIYPFKSRVLGLARAFDTHTKRLRHAIEYFKQHNDNTHTRLRTHRHHSQLRRSSGRDWQVARTNP